MDLLFLGTGTSHGVPMIGCDCAVCASGDPKNRRTRTSGLFSWDGRNILVDTSVDFREQMLRHRVKRLDGVLLTHGHADHLFGLDDIRRFNYLQKEDIGLWGNAETLGRVRSCFDYAFAPDRDTIPGGGIPRVNLHEAAGPVSLFGETILPVPVRHGPWGILGWRIRNTAWVTDCNG
ncbi:MAG: MBL fold metallo-hydrolase, partial [Planctomycetota bacterium]